MRDKEVGIYVNRLFQDLGGNEYASLFLPLCAGVFPKEVNPLRFLFLPYPHREARMDQAKFKAGRAAGLQLPIEFLGLADGVDNPENLLLVHGMLDGHLRCLPHGRAGL